MIWFGIGRTVDFGCRKISLCQVQSASLVVRIVSFLVLRKGGSLGDLILIYRFQNPFVLQPAALLRGTMVIYGRVNEGGAGYDWVGGFVWV